MPLNRICCVPLMSVGLPARSELNRSTRRSSSGRTLYLLTSMSHSCCSAASFSGISADRSCACVQSVSEYSSHLSSSRGGIGSIRVPRHAVPRHCCPALVIDAAVAEHLEVLRLVPPAALASANEYAHAQAFVAATAAHRARTSARGARGVEDRRRDVDDVMELVRISPFAAKPAGQCTIVPLRVPPQWEATCFVHWYGVYIACAQPTA